MNPSPAPRLFGTDGIRGVAGRPPLDAATVVALGRAVAEELRRDGAPQPRVLIAGDPRTSTPQLAQWLHQGLATAGATAQWGGILPTPAVALLVPQRGLDAGLVISASHNPARDNGIKLFDRQGRKWLPQRELRLEAALSSPPPPPTAWLPLPVVDATARDQYLDALVGTLPAPDSLAGMHLAIDAAHGAAAALLEELGGRLGLHVRAIHDQPDGTRINDGCGSTHPEALLAQITGSDAEIGFSFDGDADRALAADAQGRLYDGDALLYLWARALAGTGDLRPAAIVATRMSSLGLDQALARHGIRVLRSDVGDRAVAELLEREGLLLGGETSGHILHRGFATTGDGLLTALQTALILRTSGTTLAALAADYAPFPQALRNVPVQARVDFEQLPEVAAARRAVEASLGSQGRLLLRYSGTEPLARVLVESPDAAHNEELADQLAAAIRTSQMPPHPAPADTP